MGRNLIFACLIGMAALLAACSTDTLFGDLVGEERARLIAAADGAEIGPGEGLTVSVAYGPLMRDSDRSSLVIRSIVRDGAGSVRLDRSSTAAEFSTANSVTIDVTGLLPGLYRIDHTLYQGNVALSEAGGAFFITHHSYEILGIASYPVTIHPGASGLVQARLASPVGGDPFLRWTMNGRTLRESPLSAEGDLLIWDAPDKEGVYVVSVELFPFPPPPGRTYDFPSQRQLSSRLFVNSTYRPADTDLGPVADYYALFHWNGSSLDRGYREPKHQVDAGHAEPIGSPRLTVRNGIFGYHLDGRSGFRIPRFALPKGEGGPAPFALDFRLALAEAAAEGVLLAVLGADGARLWELRLGESVLFSHGPGNVEHRFDAAFTPLRPLRLSLVFEPAGDGLSISMAHDAEASVTAMLPVPWAAIAGGSDLVVGGQGGFIGILDEFGVRRIGRR